MAILVHTKFKSYPKDSIKPNVTISFITLVIFALELSVAKSGFALKLDGVGPVDNRPSTDKLHHSVQEKEKKKKKKKIHVTQEM